MAGAGISTPSGIPDFRSPGSGIYDNLKKYNLPFPEAVFEINYFQQNPKPFYDLAADLYPAGRLRPNVVHYFVKLMEEKGILKRMYTQNIDGLERLAGISEEKLVEAHGTFYTAHCRRCGQAYTIDGIVKSIERREVALCTKTNCGGVIKPDIVFFGEIMPERFYDYPSDAEESDFLMVLGTSLEVYPFASIAAYVPDDIPRLLLNRDLVGDFGRRPTDAWVSGKIDDAVWFLANAVGWKDDLEVLILKGEALR